MTAASTPDREELLASLPGRGVELALCPGCDLSSSRALHRPLRALPPYLCRRGRPPGGLRGLGGRFSLGAALPGVPRQGAGHRGDRVGLLLEGKSPPKRCSRMYFAGSWSWRSLCRCPPSSMTGRPTATASPLVKEFPPGSPACFTAIPAAWTWRWNWWSWAGIWASTAPSPTKTPKKAPEVISAVPLERILVETDAPYMAPEAFPRPAQRLHLCLPDGGDHRPDQGPACGDGGRADHRQRPAALPYSGTCQKRSEGS